MSEFTLNDLRELLVVSAGEDPGDIGGNILDTPFTDLGYDSLAVLQTMALIEHEFGLQIPDEDVQGLTTPRQALDYVNQRQHQAA
jgi:minimal PKS acyl carrier protein